jgi:hypothetical protein
VFDNDGLLRACHLLGLPSNRPAQLAEPRYAIRLRSVPLLGCTAVASLSGGRQSRALFSSWKTRVQNGYRSPNAPGAQTAYRLHAVRRIRDRYTPIPAHRRARLA